MEGERETREEVKRNRGFIVCGSLGREQSERKASERGEETRRRETVGTVRWQRPERQAALLSPPADWGLPTK